MKPYATAFLVPIKWAFLITFSFCLNILIFSVFPLMGKFLNRERVQESHLASRQMIVAEYTIKEEKKDKPKPVPMRNVTIASHNQQDRNFFNLKFTPELSAYGEGIAVATNQKMEAMVIDENEIDEVLVPKRISPIPYPAKARALEIEGTLILDLIIDIDGKVERVEVIRSPHPSFNHEALATVKKWQFSPAKIKGAPVKVRARKKIEFRLD